MRENTRQCTVSAPIEQLWPHLCDYANLLRLATPDFRVKPAGDDFEHYDASVCWEGLWSHFSVALQDAVPNTSVTWVATGDGSGGRVQLDLEPIDPDRTAVTIHYMLKTGKTLLPVEPFAWALLDRFAAEFAGNLHRLTLA